MTVAYARGFHLRSSYDVTGRRARKGEGQFRGQKPDDGVRRTKDGGPEARDRMSANLMRKACLSQSF